MTGFIVNLVDTDHAGVIADSCHKAGIPLVLINREPKADEQARWKAEKIGCFLYRNGFEAGRDLSGRHSTGDGYARRFKPRRNCILMLLMIMGEKDNEDSVSRTEYSIKALEAGGMKTEKLYSGYAGWNKEEGRKLAEKALALYGRRIEVIFCNNDAMANGAWEAIDAAGRKNRKRHLSGGGGRSGGDGSVYQGRQSDGDRAE